MDLQSYLKSKLEVIDGCLDNWLPSEEAEPGEIHQAMRYSVFAGGKRIRPILALAAAEALGGKPEQVLPAACALELIHTYSLIHDDLPAMDDDDMRRGRPSNHKVFGEAIAILAGDALLTYSFELAVSQSLQAGVAAGVLARVIEEISQASGTLGMLGGQVLDLAAEGQRVDLAGLENIHRRKTGALLRASVRVGAIIAGADTSQLQRLTRYAEALGLAFQIKDDILDIEGDSAKLGKLVGSDLAKDKSTYPALLGLDQAKQLLGAQVKIALEMCETFEPQEGIILAQIAKFVRDREN